MTAAREVVVQAKGHPRGWVILPFRLPLQHGAHWELYLMLNTGRPRSVLSAMTERALHSLDLIERISVNQYRIGNVHTDDKPLPDFIVRVSAGTTLLRVDGMLGWDYLRNVAEVRLDARALRITFVRD